MLKKYDFKDALDFLFTRTEGNRYIIMTEQLHSFYHWIDQVKFHEELDNLFNNHNIDDNQIKQEITALFNGIYGEVYFFKLDDPVNEMKEHKIFVEDLIEGQRLIIELSKPRNKEKEVLKLGLGPGSFKFRSKKIIELFINILENVMNDEVNKAIVKLVNTNKDEYLKHFKIPERGANQDPKINTELRRKIAKVFSEYITHKQIFETKNKGFLFISDILGYMGFITSKKDRRRRPDGDYDDVKEYNSYEEYCIQNVKSILGYKKD